jgi:hypothetical protein
MGKAEELIPENNSGIQTNTENSVELESEEEAGKFYEEAKRRLLDVNEWHSLAGKASASFQLTDSSGKEVRRPAEKGDFFKIDIPGPGTVTGEGNDWVQIEAIEESREEETETIVIKVRPASNPQNERKDVAHFFSEESTSSFMVKWEGKKITAAVYGRNEKPNTKTETIVDKVRNAAVATGALSGFSKLQWKTLVDALLKQ